MQYIGSYYKSDNLRKIALIPLRDVKEISEIEKVLKSNANALLFIFPKKIEDNPAFDSLVDQIQILLRNYYNNIKIILKKFFSFCTLLFKLLFNYLNCDQNKYYFNVLFRLINYISIFEKLQRKKNMFK